MNPIETMKQAHDLSLDGEHAEARLLLLSAIEQAERQEPVAQWKIPTDAEIEEIKRGAIERVEKTFSKQIALPQRQPEQEPVAREHLTKLLEALQRESNAKHNLNEWKRSSPALVVRVAQAEDEWVKAAKHLVSVEMAAQEFLRHAPPQRQPLTDEMVRQMKEKCDSMEMRGAFADGWLSAEAAHGIGGEA